MSKKIKKLAIAAVVLSIIIWVVSSMSTGSNSSPTTNEGLLTTSAGAGGGAALPGDITFSSTPGNEFSALLSSVKSITIDDSIFSNPAYKALRDHPITLGTDIIGRSNPFAPVGSDSAQGSVNPIVQTLQPGKVTSTTVEFSAQISFATTAPVSAIFQYGTSDQFGSVTSPKILTKSSTVLATITGLLPSTTYYVQAVAVVGSTTTNGNTMSFTTTTSPKP
jgi:hypothetical protein